MDWKPIITKPTLKGQLEKKLEEIAREIKEIPQNSLLMGKAGVAIFYAYYSRYTGEESYLDKALELLEEAMLAVVKTQMDHTHCSGFTGICWAYQHLSREQFIDDDVDLRDIEQYILDFSLSDLTNGNFDFMQGGLGGGLYYLEKLDSDRQNAENALVQIIDLLYAKAEKENGEIKWLSTSNTDGEQEYNFGLAHGIPSIIAFLNKCYKNNISKDLCKEMLEGVIPFIQRHQLDKSHTCHYPSIHNPGVKQINSRLATSRLAWCYGDLGIGITILNSALLLNNNVWKKSIIDTLLNSVKRRDLKEALIKDVGICHGAAGVSHIYARAYHMTALSEFKNAAIYWAEQALHLADKPEGIAGYQYYDYYKGWINSTGLLEGVAGIGLTFISLLKDISPEWDRSLLIS